LNERIRRDRAGRPGRPMIVVALAITAIVLTACGSSAAAPISAGAPPAGQGGRNGSDTGAPVPVVGGVVDGSGSQQPKPQDVAPDPNLIVRTGTMTIEVATMDAALLRARTAIAGLGGYISASDQANDGDRILASVTYRFPSARWEDAQAAIRA